MVKKVNGKLVNYGFDPKLVKIADSDWKLGAILSEPLKEDGNWALFLPIYEAQADRYETYGCTTFGTTNQIETLLNFLEGKEYNFSERYLYNLVGIEPPGANPNDVYQAIRHEGLLDQAELPMPPTLEEFRKPRPIEEELKLKGRKWLDFYTLEHEWISSPTHEQIREALKYCPIAISVTAWYQDDSGWYVDNGQANTHWCLAYRAYEDGRIEVFDSYEGIKTLHPNHKIAFAKKISIKKKPELTIMNDYKNNWLTDTIGRVVRFCTDLWKRITG